MIKVSAGIIKLNGKVLIARRTKGKHLAGYWEFPGGKIEEGENPEDCLKHKLFEEFGGDVKMSSFFMDSTHQHRDNLILLKCYKCELITGDITLNAHDKIEWVSRDELSNYKFAPANIPLIEALINEDKYDNIVYSIKSFLEIDVAKWGERLKTHLLSCMHEDASYSQRKAWFDSFNILRDQLKKIKSLIKNVDSTYIVFEYELPRERGRRPDVLILSGNNLLVIEFKGYSNENTAQIDQAKHYARDLKNYHKKSHDLNVSTFLVLASAKNVNKSVDGVSVVSGDKLFEVLGKRIKEGFNNIRGWFHSEYAPLPSLIQSAQLIFKKQPFPQIRKAKSAGIPETLKILNKIVLQAKKTNNHHLVLISGVPGAGKTLVGLQFVFESYIQEIKQKAVLLSGNGPLVSVLQSSLGNRNFIQSVHGFLKQYAHSTLIPSEDVLVYDEAQRAWDSEKVSSSRREGNNSEPTDLINIANKKSHCVIIGLIGDGQEIHLGEESGLFLWAEAIRNSPNNWEVHGPQKFEQYFKTLKTNTNFNLTTSLRTHQALTLQSWVENLLNNKVADLKELYDLLYKEGYKIYLTRKLDIAKQYLTDKYEKEEDKTYGLLASSKGKLLKIFGVNNDYNSTKAFTASQYYVEKSSSYYCKNLTSVVTEFSCQGLELDMPIIAWDNDFIYTTQWNDSFPNKKAKDSFKLRENSYRVLLTRGRDGAIIYIPNDKQLDLTFELLKESGCKIL